MAKASPFEACDPVCGRPPPPGAPRDIQALGRIVAEVGEVTTAVSEIAASAQEQAAGLAEVNTAINQMDQVTQQNAAMVEQSTAASHSLAQETAKLILMTERFQIGGIGAAMANRVFETYDAIVDVCCDAWKSLITMPERITSIATRNWAQQVTV